MAVVVGLLVVGAVVGWRVQADRPPPAKAPDDSAIRAAVAAEPNAAQAAGQHLLDTVARGGCTTPDSTDLGPLAGVGSWSRVCVMGDPGSAERQAKSDWVTGAVGVAYGGPAPIEPDVCFRSLGGGWIEWFPAATLDPAQPCPSGWHFQGA